MKKYNTLLSSCCIFGILVLSLVSCKKFIDLAPPQTTVAGSSAFEQNSTATAVILGLYIKLSDNSISNGRNSISFMAGLSADELTLFSGVSDPGLETIYTNKLASQNYYVVWENSFNHLHAINAALEGLGKSAGLSTDVKRQLLGETYFLRAFYLFYLTNFFGDVPIVVSSDYRVNAVIARSPQSKVYDQIISDLKQAQTLLTDDYVAVNSIGNANAERIRPNRSAATALLARVYLYNFDYANAEIQSSAVIDRSSQYALAPLSEAFLKESREAIWQIMPTEPSWNTKDAQLFILVDGPNDSQPVHLSNALLTAFEPGDKRKTVWTGKYTDTISKPNIEYYYPFKYKSATSGSSLTEYTIALRLGEQYLIRAESRAMLSQFTGASDDLNAIRHRAGLSSIYPIDKDEILTAIYAERRSELFTEWGHRWFDLKRSGKIDEVMSSETLNKGGVWRSEWALYPIPSQDLILNPNLNPQNPGY